MSHRNKKLALLAAALTCCLAAFFWRAHAQPRSLPGFVVRWFRGEPGALQAANDLAEDLRTLSGWAPLQSWAVSTTQRFRRGELLTNRPPRFSMIGGYHLAPSEVPEFLRKQWGGTNVWGELEPDVSVFTCSNQMVDVVLIHRYGYMIAVGPPDFVPSTPDSPWRAKAKPGIYVYTGYR